MKKAHMLLATVIVFVSGISNTTLAVGLVTGDSHAGKVGLYVKSVINFINGYLVPLALAIAFIFFIWGIVQYFVIGGANDEAKAKGKSLVIYALVGFAIILSFYGLVNFLVNGVGFGGGSLAPGDLPTVPVVLPTH